jgi:hypothetical protein
MDLRSWKAAVLSAAVLATAFVAFPICGHAHVVHPDWPQTAPPKLSKAMATQIMQHYLAQHPPAVEILLQHPVGPRPLAAYADLTRAGFLRIYDAEPELEPGPAYDLTAKGRRAIQTGFFHQPYFNLVEVRVGQFRYVPGSAVLTQPFVGTPNPRDQYNVDALIQSRPRLTFEYHFTPNANVSTLLRLGPAKDWTIANYDHPYLDLSLLRPLGKQTLSLRLCHAQWIVRESPFGSPCP